MTIELHKEQWLAQYAAVWGGYDWGDSGDLLVIKHPFVNKKGQNTFRVAGRVPIADDEGAWRIIARVAERGVSTYVDVHTIDPAMIDAPDYRTGTGSEHRYMVALILDLDTVDGEHSNLNQPTREQALRLLADAPIAPSSVVDSGGGFHVTWRLRDALELHHEFTLELVDRWRFYWECVAAATGLNIDVPYISSATSAVRPAGSWSTKAGGRPVRLVSADGTQYDYEELMELLEPRPETENEWEGGGAFSGAPEPGDPNERIGWRFSRQVGADEFLIRVFGAELRGSRMSLPLAHETSQSSTAIVTDDQGITRAIFNSTTVQQGFLLDGPGGLKSFDLLAACLGQDFHAATRLVGEWEVDGSWTGNPAFIDAIRGHMCAQVRTFFGIPEPSMIPWGPNHRRRRQATTPTESKVTDEPSEADDNLALARLLGRAPLPVSPETADRLRSAVTGLLSAASRNQDGGEFILTTWGTDLERILERTTIARAYAAAGPAFDLTILAKQLRRYAQPFDGGESIRLRLPEGQWGIADRVFARLAATTVTDSRGALRIELAQAPASPNAAAPVTTGQLFELGELMAARRRTLDETTALTVAHQNLTSRIGEWLFHRFEGGRIIGRTPDGGQIVETAAGEQFEFGGAALPFNSIFTLTPFVNGHLPANRVVRSAEYRAAHFAIESLERAATEWLLGHPILRTALQLAPEPTTIIRPPAQQGPSALPQSEPFELVIL